MVAVSIVIPVYNVETILADCLDGVVSQTFSDIEIICIDDGSTDSSGEILDRYEAADPRIRVIHQKNKGQYPTRNVALDHVRGKYMLSIDCDDMVKSNLVERLYYRAEAEQADITLMGWDYLSGPFRSPDVATWNLQRWKESPDGNTFPMRFGYVWMKLYRKRFLDQHQLRFREEFYSKADVIFHWKSMSLAERVCVVPEALYHYRVHENSVTGTIGKRFIKVIDVMEAIREELVGINDPKGLLNSWPAFALRFIYSAYQQLAPEYRPEMRKVLREFLTRLNQVEARTYRQPGTLPRETRYFYLSLESPAAAFRYGTLFRAKRAVVLRARAVFMPIKLKRRIVELVKRQSYTLTHSSTGELRDTVAELNEVVNRLAAENYRLRKQLTPGGDS